MGKLYSFVLVCFAYVNTNNGNANYNNADNDNNYGFRPYFYYVTVMFLSSIGCYYIERRAYPTDAIFSK